MKSATQILEAIFGFYSQYINVITSSVGLTKCTYNFLCWLSYKLSTLKSRQWSSRFPTDAQQSRWHMEQSKLMRSDLGRHCDIWSVLMQSQKPTVGFEVGRGLQECLSTSNIIVSRYANGSRFLPYLETQPQNKTIVCPLVPHLVFLQLWQLFESIIAIVILTIRISLYSWKMPSDLDKG